MTDQLVEASSDLTEFPGTLLLNYLVGGLSQVELPVQLLDLLLGREGVLRHLAGLHHQDGSPQVTLTFLGNPLGQRWGERATFLLGDLGDHVGDVLHAGGRHPDGQTPGPDGGDDLAGRVGHQDDSTGGHVLLHGASEGMLGVLGELVHLRQNNNLELPLSLLVELVVAGHSLDELLYDDPVIDAHVTGVDLDVIVGGDGADLYLLLARSEEVLLFNPAMKCEDMLTPDPVRSDLSLSTPGPYSSLRRHITRVFLPAPGGP